MDINYGMLRLLLRINELLKSLKISLDSNLLFRNLNFDFFCSVHFLCQ